LALKYTVLQTTVGFFNLQDFDTRKAFSVNTSFLKFLEIIPRTSQNVGPIVSGSGLANYLSYPQTSVVAKYMNAAEICTLFFQRENLIN